jgi:broad specificity phosphatase PhoE
LYRTCATAGAIYLPKKLPLQKRKDLREIYVGDWEGMTWGDIARKYPEKMKNFSTHLDKWHVDGAETPEQVRDRVVAAVREIAAENDGKTVAVFSHGCAIRILLGTLEGMSIAELGRVPCGDNTAVSLIEADGDQLKVVFRDDNSPSDSRRGERRRLPGCGCAEAGTVFQADPAAGTAGMAGIAGRGGRNRLPVQFAECGGSGGRTPDAGRLFGRAPGWSGSDGREAGGRGESGLDFSLFSRA